MEVPCPVPLTQPWSPVGYQIVELTEKTSPPGGQPPQVILAEPVSKPATKSAIPRSPVGYRVVTVADEVIPVPRKATRSLRETRYPDADSDIRLIMRQRRRTSPWAIWAPIAAILGVLAVPALGLAIILSNSRAHQEPRVVAAVVPEAIVVVPDAIRAEPPAQNKPEAPPDGKIEAAGPAPPQAAGQEACAECDPFDVANQAKPARPDREAFATAVEFVRNPHEAGRLAKQEEKLTFILHLSGNFEDPGFT